MADDLPVSDTTQIMSREFLEEMKTIPIVCPWCNRIFKVTKWQVERNKKTGVSHGMCPSCYKKMRKSVKLQYPSS
ncbi:MAG: hypothetical protein WAX69_24770 [Victivallales bacterium]